MRLWIGLFLMVAGFCLPAAAQISDLAVSDDGQTILFRSAFRLQGETDVGAQGKIYRWQNGQWTRLAAATDPGSTYASQPDVFEPFLTSDPNIFGWQINVGCFLCQLIVSPYRRSQVTGVDLPQGFPHSNLRVSRNGRYFIGDNIPFPGTKYLDLVTGSIADVPVPTFATVIREVAADGTALLLITTETDPIQQQTPGKLSLWRPGSDPRSIYTEAFVTGATLSASGGMVALESSARSGQHSGARNLIVLNTQTAEQILISPMPADVDSFFYLAKAKWDSSGVNLIYRAFDDHGQPTSVNLWSSATRESRTLLTNTEGFTNAAISGDGTVVWAVTQSNRMLRVNLASGSTDEILPPLGGAQRVYGIAVPGSAVQIRGQGFTRDQQALDGGTVLPLVDAGADGYWFQIPWEYSGTGQTTRAIVVHSRNDPFEAVTSVSVSDRINPDFPVVVDSRGRSTTKAVHQDFQSLVSSDNPAHPGETLHIYATGLGALDRPLATGEPGPFSPPARPLATVSCDLSKWGPVEVPFVAYAAGLIGVYQLDVTMPQTLGDDTPLLRCFFNGVLGIGPLIVSSH